MFYYLKGNIDSVSPKFIVIDIAGVGYQVFVPNPFNYSNDIEYKLYIKEIIKEDSITLYGFNSIKERDLFDLLLSVSGIGPKSALSILAGADVSEIEYNISIANEKFLRKFPGIGPKASQQIILDLKSKVKASNKPKDNKLDDLALALEALGYKNKDIEVVINKLDFTNDLSTLIKLALKYLNK